MAEKKIMKQEPEFISMENEELESSYVDTDSSYPVGAVAIVPEHFPTTKAEVNDKFGMEVTRRLSPKKVAFEGGGTAPEFLNFLQNNPEIFLRKSSFDGMGEPFTSDDLEGEKAWLYECEMLDYDGLDKDTGEIKHFRYSVWLGVRESDNISFVYSAGKQLTELCESLILPENKAVKDAVSEKGIHVIFNMIKLKSNPKKSFMKVQVIP